MKTKSTSNEMEDSAEIHEEILDWAAVEFKEILENSDQAIYIYVCDRHRLCNKNFSLLIGYDSPEEWAMEDEMLSDVKESDQETLVKAYRAAMENKIGSCINISWKNKNNGEFVSTQTILVPLSYRGELFAMHFIESFEKPKI